LDDTSNFFKASYPDWKVDLVPDFNMASVNWGLEMSAMIMGEEDHDKGRNQKTCFYFTIPNMDKEVKRLEKLGAKILKAPTDVGGAGSYAYLQAPGDLSIGLWSSVEPPKPKVATRKLGDKQTVTFFEIISTEPEATEKFLNSAYGWKFNSYPMGGKPYWYWGEGEKLSVGLRGLDKGEKGSDLVAHVNEGSLKALSDVVKNGAKKVGGVRDYGQYGKAQLFKAPGGITVGIYEGGKHGSDEKGSDEKGHGEEAHDDMEVEEKPKKAAAKKASPKKAAARKPRAKAAPKAAAKGKGAKKGNGAAKKKAPAKKAAAAKKKPASGGVAKKKRAAKK